MQSTLTILASLLLLACAAVGQSVSPWPSPCGTAADVPVPHLWVHGPNGSEARLGSWVVFRQVDPQHGAGAPLACVPFFIPWLFGVEVTQPRRIPATVTNTVAADAVIVQVLLVMMEAMPRAGSGVEHALVIPVPNDPNLLGLTMHFQSAWTWGGANFRMMVSNPVTLTVLP